MTETLRHYDRWSATYDAQDNPMVGATGWVLDQAPLACDGATVIELGCGTARHVERILAAGARGYVGVDGSPGMLDAARRRVADPRVRFVDGDLAAPLPVDAGGFELALIVLVLEHVRELDGPFREIGRALRPGGRLRLVEIHPDRVAAGTVAHFRDAAGEVAFDSVAHPIAALRAALAHAGFAVEAVREWIADDALVAAVPRIGKHRGLPVVVDVVATRR